MKQLIISVTMRDITGGIRRSLCSCPIANSLRRRYPNADIEVGYDHVYIGRRAIPITDKMETWMNDYDAGRPVSPTAFFVDAAI